MPNFLKSCQEMPTQQQPTMRAISDKLIRLERKMNMEIRGRRESKSFNRPWKISEFLYSAALPEGGANQVCNMCFQNVFIPICNKAAELPLHAAAPAGVNG